MFFLGSNKSVLFTVPNKFGKQGWTFINLTKVRPAILLDTLTIAYCLVAPAKLVNQFKLQDTAQKVKKKDAPL